jgi:hypothetical protein
MKPVPSIGARPPYRAMPRNRNYGESGRFASITTVHASVHASVHATVHATVYVSTDCAILAVLQQAAQSALSSSGVQMHLISKRIRITTRLASDAAYLPLKQRNCTLSVEPKQFVPSEGSHQVWMTIEEACHGSCHKAGRRGSFA